MAGCPQGLATVERNHGRRVDTATPVILGEPRPLMRVALSRCLAENGFSVRGEGGDAAAVIDLALAEEPKLCVLASDLPGSVTTAIVAITSALPETGILVMAEQESASEAFETVRMGASGYLSKNIPYDALSRALRGMLHGEAAMSRNMTARLFAEIRAIPPTGLMVGAGDQPTELTHREAQVLRLLSRGSSTAEIASALSISPITARRHCGEIRQKLGARDRAAVVALATRQLNPE
jgi:DNA-binding NarL/FixJ family response regulator